MSLINRNAMIVIPRKPLYEWQNRIFPDAGLELTEDPLSHDGGHIYLIPELESDVEFEEWIKEHYQFFLKLSLRIGAQMKSYGQRTAVTRSSVNGFL